MTKLISRQSGGSRWILIETVGVTLVAAILVRLQTADGGRTGLLAPAVWVYIPLAVIAARRLSLQRYGFAVSAWRSGWKSGAMSVLFILIPFALLSTICCGIVDPSADFALGSIVGRLGAADPLYQLAVVVVPEELFFRGYLQTRITEWAAGCARSNPWIPILLTALLFALAHVMVEPGLMRVAVFFPGVVMGWLRQCSGGLLAPAGFHWLANLLSAALAFRV